MSPARGLIVAGSAVALSFLAARFIALPGSVEIAWKAGGVALLGAGALVSGARLLAAALFLSAVGDVMLELKPPQMAAGMAAFGAAHLFYAAIFAGRIRKDGVHEWSAISVALLVAASLSLLLWLLPDMGALTAPGVAYHLVITAMAALALASKAPLAAKTGALVFMLSDALIALGLYKGLTILPGTVWITYAAAQILLAASLSKPGQAR